MTCREQDSGEWSAVELIAERGMEALPQALTALINEAMRLERERHLGVGAYERSEDRRGYANGYKPKRVKTRVGELDLAVPQVREGGFYPQSLEKGLRSERALKLALAEMYVSGVSTRKVARITEQLCGFEVSSSQVSRCAALLDEELSGWRERTLGAYPYVVLDARYESIRHGGQVGKNGVRSCIPASTTFVSSHCPAYRRVVHTKVVGNLLHGVMSRAIGCCHGPVSITRGRIRRQRLE